MNYNERASDHLKSQGFQKGEKHEADGQQPQCDGGEAEGAAVTELYHSFLLDGSMT